MGGLGKEVRSTVGDNSPLTGSKETSVCPEIQEQNQMIT